MSGKQDHDEEPPHALQGSNTHIFDIQALFLVGAIAMFDPSAQATVFIDRFNLGQVCQRHIGQQNQRHSA